MDSLTPVPSNVEDNPNKPWKAVISAVVAGLAVLLTYADVLPQWVMIGGAVLLAGLLTFVTPNPKQFK